ncbi:hypothetical protein O7635_19330 [Asanoa sp. WMMD1127]|uniref:hypothetical protein n=1 Tax=Asanoa sp. WMMD1127 TaxID=3016107 RepID=UPI002416E133|nr:hypothetical protein [Asanoa sp. WMMD1127]MDG4824013.1 hypothetical protein [Asanoa sp. WMMD1127]
MSLAKRIRAASLTALLTVTLFVGAVGCASDDSAGALSNSGDASERFWETFRITGDEVEPYAPMGSMVMSADATVLGRFSGVGKMRTVSAEAGDSVHYLAVNLSVSRQLAGGRIPSPVPVEFMISAQQGAGPDDAVKEVSASLPQGEMVVFLRHKGGAEAGLYRVVNSRGLWTATSRDAIDTPLAEQPARNDDHYKADLASVASVSALADAVDRMR